MPDEPRLGAHVQHLGRRRSHRLRAARVEPLVEPVEDQAAGHADAIAPTATPIVLNGRLGLEIAGGDGDRSVLSFGVGAGRITRIDVVRNPEKLHHVLPAQKRSGDSGPSAG